MKRFLHRFGKFYSGVIINFIGIFIFVGILSVVFGDYGWMPDKNIYAISQFVYHAVLPVLIAYVAGNRVHRKEPDAPDRLYAGGAIAVMAVSGGIIANGASGILEAMILGPLCGLLWKWILAPLIQKVKTGLEMLVRNVVAALAGVLMAVVAFYVITPVITMLMQLVMRGMDVLIGHNLIFLLSVIIEPSKVFFLNNSINHGILLPLGIQQAEQTGESILFLLESNPGPGLGILLALYLERKEKRKEYGTAMFVEFVGGVHEIYFPEVLSNLWLLLALISGGMAGNLCFSILHAAATGAVSPGSILAVLLVCLRYKVLRVLLGILVSAVVSAVTGVLILKIQDASSETAIKFEENAEIEREPKSKCETEMKYKLETKNESETNAESSRKSKMETKPEMNTETKMTDKQQIKVGFVCNAGVGSSAMGAALFRRKIKELEITNIEVSAYAADQIPEDLDAVICQKELIEVLAVEVKAEKVYALENLLNQEEYTEIIKEL